MALSPMSTVNIPFFGRTKTIGEPLEWRGKRNSFMGGVSVTVFQKSCINSGTHMKVDKLCFDFFDAWRFDSFLGT